MTRGDIKECLISFFKEEGLGHGFDDWLW